MSKRISVAIVGGIIIAVTLAAYFMLIDGLLEFQMAWMTMVGLLVSEIAAVAANLLAGDKPVKVAAASGFAAHTVIALVLSVLYIHFWSTAYLSYWLLYIVTFAIVLCVAVILYSFQHSRQKAAVQLAEAKNNMFRSRAVISGLLVTEEGKRFSKELNLLDEDIRFTDDSVICELDDKVYEKVCGLSQHLDGDSADAAIEELRGLIRQRNLLVKNQKANRD